MNKLLLRFTLAILTFSAASFSQAQLWQKSHIGYAYPAGGQTGTTFEVTVGGKGLNKVELVQITGSGVQGEFVQHIGNYKRKLQEQFRVIRQERSGNPNQVAKSKERRFGPPPDHEIFTRLEELTEKEFRLMAQKFQKKERIQRNREINELAIIRVTIAPDARPGLRELRLVTKGGGITNPIRFMVNTLPEERELEPNDQDPPEGQSLRPPFIMNGQIMPGDEDQFLFYAEKGQKLVVHAQARELVPYLADAVPGWFQAVLTIYDEKGREMAFVDDFLFNPDPAMLFEVPESGSYRVSIRDSIYRGRDDFVYRLTVGETPFVTGIFPLGGQAESETVVTAYGWNIDAPALKLNTRAEGPATRMGFLRSGRTISNYVRYEVGEFPESYEIEVNDSAKSAQSVDFPSVINGRIDEPGDIDYFTISIKDGQTIKLKVDARRLHSPVDSLLRVFDSTGQVLTWNDDVKRSGNMTDRTGLLTHHSDSEIEFTAQETGVYLVQVSDSQNQGGETYAYRLSIAEPEPDFDLYVTPSAISVTTGGGAKATLHVKRKNGYTGPIEINLQDNPYGLKLTGGSIPENCDLLPVVISHKGKPINNLVSLNLFGTADLGDKKVTHRAIPADDITQAFITHHLVESSRFFVNNVRGNRRHPTLKSDLNSPTILSPDRTTVLKLNMGSMNYDVSKLQFELEEAPEGVTLEAHSGILETTLNITSPPDLKPGQSGNLIVAVSFESVGNKKNGSGKTRKIPLGNLPAIPYATQ